MGRILSLLLLRLAACGQTVPPGPRMSPEAETERTIGLIRDYCATQQDVNSYDWLRTRGATISDDRQPRRNQTS
jgi:hypothetical protein